MNPQQLPDTGYVDQIFASMNRYPFVTQSLVLGLIAVAFILYLHKKKD